MITPSRLVKAAVLSCATAVTCSLLAPAASAVAAHKTDRAPAVAQVPAVPAPASGLLTGTVRALGGPGLAGVCVLATGPAGVRPGFTSAGGRYVLSGLRPGEYRVDFRDCAQPGRYAGQWYGGSFTAHGAKSVAVAPGRPTLLGPVTLRPLNAMAYLAASARAFRSGIQPAAGSRPVVSGTVTDSRGKPVAGICVEAIPAGGNGASGGGPGGPGIRTGKNGTYHIPRGQLGPGRWTIFFSAGCGNKGNFAPQSWKFAATEAKAKVLVIRRGSHFTGINARLGKGAAISGTIRAGSKSGPGLPGACVTAFGVTANPDQIAETRTGAGGKYLITGLGTGEYSLEFDAGCGAKGFADSPATPVAFVTDGKTTKGVDGFLPRAGNISGTVTDGSDHQPVAGICVAGATSFGNTAEGFVTATGPAGQYAIGGLPPGRYVVEFTAGCGSKGSFAPQAYKDQASLLAPNPVVVKGGAHLSGIDAVMQPGGTVTGTVTSAAGQKLSGVCVFVSRQTEATGGDTLFGLGLVTDAPSAGGAGRTVDGRYRVTDLSPGNYSVMFSSGCGRHQPAEGSQWFSPVGQDQMSLVTVGPGTVSGIDAKLPAPGTITGVVTGPTGKPARGICVFPIPLRGEPVNPFLELEINTNASNKHGVYRLNGLAAGKYGLEFAACESDSFTVLWYRQASGFSGLTPVAVRSGHVTAGINQKMVAGQSVSGRITRAYPRTPVRGCVIVTDPSGNIVSFGQSAKDGDYKVGHLAPGTYNFLVTPCASNGLATIVKSHVKVGSSRPTTGVNVALPVAGELTGQVRGGDPAQTIGGACVIATPMTGAGAVSTVFSTFNGRYTVPALAPGKYRVRFSSLCPASVGGFVSQWFDGKAFRGSATPVTVTSAKTTGGIDATLAADGAISGSVQAAGAAKAGVCAIAFPKAGGTPTIGVTGANGGYLIGGLSPGQYVVEFTGGCGVKSYRTQWFDGASSRKGATSVVVKVGLTTAGINAH